MNLVEHLPFQQFSFCFFLKGFPSTLKDCEFCHLLNKCLSRNLSYKHLNARKNKHFRPNLYTTKATMQCTLTHTIQWCECDPWWHGFDLYTESKPTYIDWFSLFCAYSMYMCIFIILIVLYVVCIVRWKISKVLGLGDRDE